MTGGSHLLLVVVFIATSNSGVYGCLRIPSQSDVDKLNRDVGNLQDELYTLKNSKKEVKVGLGDSETLTQLNNELQDLKQNVDILAKTQSQSEQLTVSIEALEKETKEVIDRLAKEVDNKVETTKKLLKEIQEKLEKQQNESKESLKKIDGIDKTVKAKLKDFEKSLHELDSKGQEEFDEVKQSVAELKEVVNSDLKTKVTEFDSHIKSIQVAKTDADRLLSDLQEVVDKIRPNTFNKGGAVAAFLLVVMFVFFLAIWVHRLQESIEKIKKQQ